MATNMTVLVSFGGITREVSCPLTGTLNDLKLILSTEFDVPVDRQTILAKGVKLSEVKGDSLLKDFGIVSGKKILLIGSTRTQAELVEQSEREAVLENEKRARARANAVQPREEKKSLGEYTFQRIEALPGFTEESRSTREAEAYLNRIRHDRAVQDIMNAHKWTVGLLREFQPSLETGIVGISDSCLLGYNQNKGEVIALRIRTDNLRGFRHYRIVMETVMHELAHMVHSEHDRDFHALNRQLLKEYEASRFKNDFQDEAYDDEPTFDIHQRLGGSPQSSRRPQALAAAAALQRLTTLTSSPVAIPLAMPQAGATPVVPTSGGSSSGSPATGRKEGPSPAPPGSGGARKSAIADGADGRAGRADAGGAGHHDARPMETDTHVTAPATTETPPTRRPPLDDDDDDTPNPYVYRPRRSLRVGAEYQVAVPAWEGPPGPHAGAADIGQRTTVEAVMQAEKATLSEEAKQKIDAFEKEPMPHAAKVSCLHAIQHILLNLLEDPSSDTRKCVRIKDNITEGASLRDSAVAILEAVGFQRQERHGERVLWCAVVDEAAMLGATAAVTAALARAAAEQPPAS